LEENNLTMRGKRKFTSGSGRFNRHNQDFRCGHCLNLISANFVLAGVKNRNHCPICLWSKHVDSQEAGDRLAACKGLMKPIGLTLKKTRKKYGPGTGELMLVHECSDCGKLSINRIAADDDVERIFEIFNASKEIDTAVKARLEESEIAFLSEEDRQELRAQLLGKDEEGN
jgi:hypothetical protein